jgi:hypothetical protein
MPASSYAAASENALNRWLDDQTAKAAAEYAASTEGRLKAADARASELQAEQTERSRLVAQADLILANAPGMPPDLSKLTEQEKLEYAGLVERDRPFEGQIDPRFDHATGTKGNVQSCAPPQPRTSRTPRSSATAPTSALG